MEKVREIPWFNVWQRNTSALESNLEATLNYDVIVIQIIQSNIPRSDGTVKV